jgi:hypothetical protein
LPAFGVHLPFTKTMIGVTFAAGLLPVVGNLVSNTVVVIVSLSSSASVALASLAFLVVVHKLEYFLNARIVGHAHRRAHVGAPARDAGDGSGVRPRRRGRRADLLRVRQVELKSRGLV